jgi:DNA-binding NtrC family response regulator
MKNKILVIDDEESIRYTFREFLTDNGCSVMTAASCDDALGIINENDFDLIFLDIVLGGKSGVEVLREIKGRDINSLVVMITGMPAVETASEALRLGAFDYIVKPVTQQMLSDITIKALRHKSLMDEKEKYRLNLEAVFRSVKDAIITVDERLTVTAMNDAAKDVCPYLAAGIKGTPFDSMQRACAGRCVEALRRTLKDGEFVEMLSVECLNERRKEQIVNIAAYPLMNCRQQQTGAVLVVRDESRIVSLERDMKDRRQFHNMTGRSEKMQEIYSLVEKLADVGTTVLITGESGTGKELIADAIHYKGARADKPLVKVNCSALPDNLMESELFGHVKGAFTGAIRDKAGRFEMADGGTIFLDEIGDISPSIQLKLLRVIQEKEIERVGDARPVKVDVRIVAATNKDLKEKVGLGEFREDLFYRLKVVEIKMPSLRERKEDVPLLAAHFIKRFNKKLNRDIEEISSDVRNIFMNYNWPGNIRELEHALEHACIVCGQPIISIADLPDDLRNSRPLLPAPQKGVNESGVVFQALEKTGWNKARAAKLLGISRRTIYRKIEEYGIVRPR